MKKRLPKASVISFLLILSVLLFVWLICMYCVTAVKAEREAYEYLEENTDRATTLALRNFGYLYYDATESDKYRDYLEAVSSTGTFSNGNPVTEGNSGFFEFYDQDHTYAANALFDGDGNMLLSSADDFFHFEYMTEEQWLNNEERSDTYTRAIFDRDLLTNEDRTALTNYMDARALRFTGKFEGTDFVPSKIEYIDRDEFDDILWSRDSSSYTVSGIVNAYDIEWHTLYENKSLSFDDSITIYSDWFGCCFPEESPRFKYMGSEYDLNELMAELGPTLSEGRQVIRRYEGKNLIIVSANYAETINGETDLTPYYYGDAVQWEEGTEHSMDFYLVSIVLCSPWETAVHELVFVYAWTFIIMMFTVLILHRFVNNQFTYHIDKIGDALNKNLPPVSNDVHKTQEIANLYNGYNKISDICHFNKNEINRLNTALNYAKTAEENRRQMTSNIAHELKTPLAIIHSYAEGLKEQIAEEKRDKYLDVILSESERMDAMVLEMLDLSRLEAGKVKLSNDKFSLQALAKSVFSKLDIAIEAKDIILTFECSEDTMVTADEARIAQVIENFATNAVKYTPAGGFIKVLIIPHAGKMLFSVENKSAPLSQEALSKVWDTFYRTDESRSGGGTGLGLAIAKNIIELHGGKCSVRNTKDGVQFRFTI